jgi:hypothetical protein
LVLINSLSRISVPGGIRGKPPGTLLFYFGFNQWPPNLQARSWITSLSASVDISMDMPDSTSVLINTFYSMAEMPLEEL